MVNTLLIADVLDNVQAEFEASHPQESYSLVAAVFRRLCDDVFRKSSRLTMRELRRAMNDQRTVAAYFEHLDPRGQMQKTASARWKHGDVLSDMSEQFYGGKSNTPDGLPILE